MTSCKENSASIADIRLLFESGFDESAEWVDWYFGKVFDPDSAMVTYVASQPVSCLMLDPYRLKLGKSQADIGYISCATTIRHARGNGHMKRLIIDTVLEASQRGYAAVTLIPATDRLYGYYARVDFAPVFFIDEQRYTALHSFSRDDSLREIEPTYDDYHHLEMQERSIVLHSRANFDNILTDNLLSHGEVVSLADKMTGEPRAMLFATITDEAATVRCLLSTDEAAAESALAVLRSRIGRKMIVVWAMPGKRHGQIVRRRGLLRIASVEALLKAIAEHAPDTELVLRITDTKVPDNNGVFIIHKGEVEHVQHTIRRPTIDTDIATLSRIIFNSPRVGEIFGLPTFRPAMSLMLD